jgi:hypothetical protein
MYSTVLCKGLMIMSLCPCLILPAHTVQRHQPYYGRLQARPISVSNLVNRVDGRWTGDPYPLHGRTHTTVWRASLARAVWDSADAHLIYAYGRGNCP